MATTGSQIGRRGLEKNAVFRGKYVIASSEAVTIQQVSSEKPILNSRSEWNQSVLPCLVTRLGNKEDELKKMEKELKEEKRIDDVIEESTKKG